MKHPNVLWLYGFMVIYLETIPFRQLPDDTHRSGARLKGRLYFYIYSRDEACLVSTNNVIQKYKIYNGVLHNFNNLNHLTIKPFNHYMSGNIPFRHSSFVSSRT